MDREELLKEIGIEIEVAKQSFLENLSTIPRSGEKYGHWSNAQEFLENSIGAWLSARNTISDILFQISLDNFKSSKNKVDLLIDVVSSSRRINTANILIDVALPIFFSIGCLIFTYFFR